MKPVAGLQLQGRYELVEQIALGGMGQVWRATDLRSGRAVAAKILRPELTGDEIFLARHTSPIPPMAMRSTSS